MWLGKQTYSVPFDFHRVWGGSRQVGFSGGDPPGGPRAGPAEKGATTRVAVSQAPLQAGTRRVLLGTHELDST